MVRSVLAILAGVVTLTVTSFAIEAVVKPWIEASLPAGSWAVWVATMAYSVPCVVLGGYATARAAKSKPVKHALAYGFVMAALTIILWISPPPGVPYQSAAKWILGIALLLPFSWLGGALHARRGSKL
jgi:hypothetical protein